MADATPHTCTALARTHAIVPDHPDPDFTFVPDSVIADHRISLDALGLLFNIATYRAEKVTIDMLVAGGPDSEESIRSGLAELHEYGYLSNYRLIGGGNE